jgi:hypothetical protein
VGLRWPGHAPFAWCGLSRRLLPQKAHPNRHRPRPRATLHALQTVRDDVAARLEARRQDPAFPLRGHTLEECCEVLVMPTCGQDIVLLVDRDP